MKRAPLSLTHPDLAAQAVGWDPSTVTSGVDKKVQWKCAEGHIWIAAVNKRTAGQGCPICTGKSVLVGYNDLATFYPELALQADGWDPSTVTAGSGQKKRWKCSLGHIWESPVSRRTQGTGCPICAGQSLLVGFNDLATTHPDIAAEADGWDPSSMSGGSNKKYKWKCAQGHRWEAKAQSRTSRNLGCPYCSNNLVLTGFNDLATTHPDIAAEADGWDPSQVILGSNKKYKWRCKDGHTWEASITSRKFAESGCPYCSNNLVLTGFNDLATTHPDIAAEADGWDPSQVSTFSNLKAKWKCAEGHTWTSTIGNRSRGTDCPSCSLTGYDPNKDGWIYFLEHELWGLLQIGISNVPDERLSTHRASGWVVRELRGPLSGDVAHQWEQDILHALKKREVRLAPKHIAGKFSGYTESWIQEDFPARSLAELMQLVHDDEERI